MHFQHDLQRNSTRFGEQNQQLHSFLLVYNSVFQDRSRNDGQADLDRDSGGKSLLLDIFITFVTPVKSDSFKTGTKHFMPIFIVIDLWAR